MTLPAFLLAFTNNNFVWLGFKKYTLPAAHTRWSLARFLSLVAIKTAAAVLLALLISLAIAGQPWGWLMWLLGLFAASQSIVMSGLTALCWNQRAARLRENPNLPLNLPPARFRFGRWLLGLIYVALLALLTPLVTVVTVENVRGQMVWKREQTRMAANGERLNIRDILGPEIPPAENAGAASVFAPFFDYPPGSLKLSREATNAIARFAEALFLPSNHFPEKPRSAPRPPKQVENMGEWSAAYRKMVAAPAGNDPSWVKELRLPPPGNPARDVLAGLAMGDDVVNETCEAAARSRSQFPNPWQHGFPLDFPHLSRLKQVQIHLRLRCAAHLAAGETDAAFAVATNALNVAELLREEPILISQLVRFANNAIALDTLWQGLAQHRWTGAQLAAFQDQLARRDFVSGLILAFEGERACSTMGMEELITNPPPLQSGVGGVDFRPLGILVPFGMLRQNQAAMARFYTELLTELRTHLADAPQSGFARLIQPRAERERLTFERMGFSPSTMMVKLLAPATAKAEIRAAKAQTMNALAITACALERYRLAHGSYPETLDPLVPALMAKPLLDPMNAQPFRYRRTDDGWFLLYSVGDNGRDDNGVFRVKSDDPAKPGEILDWTWPVPGRADNGSLF